MPPVKPEDLQEIAKDVLRLMGVYGAVAVKLTGAFKSEGIWRVNYSYKTTGGIILNVGSFAVDEQMGDIKGMWLDREWKTST